MKLAFIFAFAFATSSIACSSGGDTRDSDGGEKKKSTGMAVNPSCTGISANICTDYVGSAIQGSVKQVCTWDGGYSMSACPEANRVGSCTVGATGDPNQVIRRYYSPAFNAMAAQTDCSGVKGAFAAD